MSPLQKVALCKNAGSPTGLLTNVGRTTPVPTLAKSCLTQQAHSDSSSAGERAWSPAGAMPMSSRATTAWTSSMPT